MCFRTMYSADIVMLSVCEVSLPYALLSVMYRIKHIHFLVAKSAQYMG